MWILMPISNEWNNSATFCLFAPAIAGQITTQHTTDSMWNDIDYIYNSIYSHTLTYHPTIYCNIVLITIGTYKYRIIWSKIITIQIHFTRILYYTFWNILGRILLSVIFIRSLRHYLFLIIPLPHFSSSLNLYYSLTLYPFYFIHVQF